jgi:hypothetical protein
MTRMFEVLLQGFDGALNFVALELGPCFEFLWRHHLTVLRGRQRKSKWSPQKHHVFLGSLIAQR